MTTMTRRKDRSHPSSDLNAFVDKDHMHIMSVMLCSPSLSYKLLPRTRSSAFAITIRPGKTSSCIRTHFSSYLLLHNR